MAYRSLKRVLDETSLERKCRILFGASLLVLIASAFCWVAFHSERMVLETTRQKGRDRVDTALLRLHFEVWDTQSDPNAERLLNVLISDLDNREYIPIFLAFEGEGKPNITRTPADETEREIMLWMKQQLAKQRIESARRASRQIGDENDRADPDMSGNAGDDGETIWRERLVLDESQYHYFEPVNWKENCSLCHPSNSASADLLGPEGPFRVVKIVMPYSDTQAAIQNARASLMIAGIITVTVAMLLLYFIVRYVIVRPLRHLRDVSDAISRGKTELRAEINTNDEFEELAESFNRMLRHLTDTQADLRQVNTDLDGKIEQLAQANMRLYEMNRLKSDFLANMSHELRTPLNSIIGFSEVLQGIDSLNDRQKRYARNIQRSGRVLLEMINDILDLAKMEAGKMELRPTEFRIGALLQSQCDLVRSLADDKNIDLEVESDGNIPMLYQDQGKLQQILTNLLSNAIKFTPDGGRIRVSARPTARDRFELTVSDTGVGIAEEDRAVIFEKFRQGAIAPGGDNLTREYSGTGLGLSIVKELCVLLGGEISVESAVGKGSSFTVELPVTCPAQPRTVEIDTHPDAPAGSVRGAAPLSAEPSESDAAPNFTPSATVPDADR